METLVLDWGLQPHRRVGQRRALSLLMRGAVEVLEEYDEEVYRSATVVIKLPAVVRLLSVVPRKKSVRLSRRNVMLRDDFTCQYCGRRRVMRKLNLDHVVPRAQGGKSTWENLVASCVPCNDNKRDRTPDQAGMRLRRQPMKPKSLPVVGTFQIEDSKSVPDIWASYIYWHGQLEE